MPPRSEEGGLRDEIPQAGAGSRPPVPSSRSPNASARQGTKRGPDAHKACYFLRFPTLSNVLSQEEFSHDRSSYRRRYATRFRLRRAGQRAGPAPSFPLSPARIQQAKAENTQVVFTLDTHEENYMNTREGRFLPCRTASAIRPAGRLSRKSLKRARAA